MFNLLIFRINLSSIPSILLCIQILGSVLSLILIQPNLTLKTQNINLNKIGFMKIYNF